MKARIFYFTGTGNSLVAAKKIAEGIGGCIDPIVRYKEQQTVKINEDVIGIVFPVYLAQIYGLPEIVSQFLGKIEYVKNKYYFIVCTYGGYAYPNAFPTINRCIKIARSPGWEINGRFYARFPMNNSDYDHIPVPIERDSSIILAKADKKIESIIEMIKKRKKGNIIAQNIFNFTLGRLLSITKEPIMRSMRKYAQEKEDSKLTYPQLVHLSDQSIKFNEEKCNGCGICEKVCPVSNIKMENGKPFWMHNCEMCFACDEWCPQKAIHHWGKLEGKDYHHPSIKVTDIIEQRLFYERKSIEQ